MQLRVDRKGDIITLYNEVIDLAKLGAQSIRRASNVEPDGLGGWSTPGALCHKIAGAAGRDSLAGAISVWRSDGKLSAFALFGCLRPTLLFPSQRIYPSIPERSTRCLLGSARSSSVSSNWC
jgi:hypothetical protein